METKGKECCGFNTLGIGVGSIHDVAPKNKLINIGSHTNVLLARHLVL